MLVFFTKAMPNTSEVKKIQMWHEGYFLVCSCSGMMWGRWVLFVYAGGEQPIPLWNEHDISTDADKPKILLYSLNLKFKVLWPIVTLSSFLNTVFLILIIVCTQASNQLYADFCSVHYILVSSPPVMCSLTQHLCILIVFAMDVLCIGCSNDRHHTINEGSSLRDRPYRAGTVQ